MLVAHRQSGERLVAHLLETLTQLLKQLALRGRRLKTTFVDCGGSTLVDVAESLPPPYAITIALTVSDANSLRVARIGQVLPKAALGWFSLGLA